MNVENALAIARKVFPSLRLGQLIDNALHLLKEETGLEYDLFYITDEELAKALFRFARKR